MEHPNIPGLAGHESVNYLHTVAKHGGVSKFSNFVTLGVLHLPHIVLERILKYCCLNLTLSAIPGMIKLSNAPKMFGDLYLPYFQEVHLGAHMVVQLE